jgi:phosphatidylglycerophosphate synthase
VNRGEAPEKAEVWKLDRPEGLAGAEQELTRRLTYQPLGKYWAFPIAERLAAALAPSRVTPNAVTLAAGACMLSGIAAVASGNDTWLVRLFVATCFVAGLVLDTADGRLARLQGKCSPFGRWLDQVLDEAADVVLHGAIAWAAFRSTTSPAWLLAGMIFISGKYLFLVQSLTGEEMEKAESSGSEPSIVEEPRRGGSTTLARRIVAAAGHADLRWHLGIVLAAVGRLDVALIAYAIYFPFRALVGIARKGMRHG